MRISDEELDNMFRVAGVTRSAMYDALRTMGAKAIKPAFRSGWSEPNPTRGACYFVSEFAYFYLSPKGTVPCSLVIPGDPGLHRFLRYPTGTIIDLTAEQFPDYALIRSLYPNAKTSYFLQTACTGPSKRARTLAGLLGFTEYWKASC
jgi:hypothetical protein